MHHPTGMVTGKFREPVEGYRGPFRRLHPVATFLRDRQTRGFVRGYQMQLVRSDGPVGTACGGYLPRLPWGEGHHKAFRETFAHTASLTVTTEDLPRNENRVVLSDSLVDRWASPHPR